MLGDAVAAVIDGFVTLKTYTKEDGKLMLKARNAAYKNPKLTADTYIQGVMVGKLERIKGEEDKWVLAGKKPVPA